MEPSIGGLLVCAALVLLGVAMRAPLIVPLFASFAFGSTAIVNLPALGGASPLIYTAFAGLIVLSAVSRRGFAGDLKGVFTVHRVSYIVLALLAYVCLSAIIFPRFFLGETNVFVARSDGKLAVLEVPLAPSGGNITQTAYFAIGALTFFAILILLTRFGRFELVRKGFLAWIWCHVVLSMLSLAGNMAGAGDILMPIRTANYAFLTDTELAGFTRLVGAFSEASSFGSASFGCLGFTYAYWTVTREPVMLGLTVLLATFLFLSTSSTAYGALFIALALVFVWIMKSVLVGRLSMGNVYVLGIAFLGGVLVLCLILLKPEVFDPVVRLFETTILTKGDSESARERGYWNTVSLQAMVDTGLLGVGMGSSRASSWWIAVLSQLGVPGALLIFLLVIQLFRRAEPGPAPSDLKIAALHEGARANAICLLIAGTISGGSADPGIQVFIALATVVACRRNLLLARRAPAAAGPPSTLQTLPQPV
jgi:hypothetical protein